MAEAKKANITYEDISRVNSEIDMIDLHGKDYAMVAERVTAFRKLYPEGFIKTQIVTITEKTVLIKVCAGYYREDGGEVILSTGYAQETFGRGVNATNPIENCVPLDTQILTENGWKYYYQIDRDDLVYSLNMDTGVIELCKVERVNVYKDHPLVELKTSRFKAVCTPQHKWIIRSQGNGIRKKATEDLAVSEKIVQNVRQNFTESEIGRKLGWLMCDCEIQRTANGMPSCAYIRQSKHVDDITDLFGEGRPMKKYSENWLQSYEWIVPAETVREIFRQFGISTYADLKTAMLKADINDVAGCFHSMMLADGEERGFSSTYYDLIEAVQIMCVRLGIATGHIKSRMMNGSTKPIHTLTIKKTDGAWFSEMKMKVLPPKDVWCPTTENGTWFMKQGDFVTLTSNCETSAVGRCLGFIGIGSKADIASAEEVVNSIVKKREAIKEFNETGRDEIAAEKVAALDAEIQQIRKDAPATVTKTEELPW